MIKNNINIIRRYRLSIFIDQIIYASPLTILIFLIYKDYNNFSLSMKYGITSIIMIWTIILFLSDVVFMKRSIGKRILGLKIINTTKSFELSVKLIVMRRIYDMFNQLLIGKSFAEKCSYIDEQTNTRFVQNTYNKVRKK